MFPEIVLERPFSICKSSDLAVYLTMSCVLNEGGFKQF